MKKFLTLLCLSAILCVGYLAVVQSGSGSGPDMDDIKAGADKIADQVSDMYEEYGSAAAKQVDDALGDKAEKADSTLEAVVEQADETLGNVAEQADEAIENAVDSAVKSAKESFVKSLKQSVSDFFANLSAQDDSE